MTTRVVAPPAQQADPAPPTWEQVVRDYQPRVYRLAYRLTGNHADAEDLAQDTFVRVFRSLARYEPGTFEGWLHRITTNLFLDGARRRARIRFVPLLDDGDRLPAHGADPERIALDGRLDADLERALAGLSPVFRAAVLMADVQQVPYDEIAAIQGVEPGTVRSRVHRGRKQLRRALEAPLPV